ncbi:succinate--CoA ligase subunit alpha [Metallumcola ferriviriculae]|uniref:Succinate--CoA ligase [ADP-forming] subunit alpha n=1 Tax=Metallumcola ferriviriculae TaxID=3039180 RepID=A0AAU0UQD3_9FIRM|nr:succinate--CoA ligase subunit alpha [Desulfitibacteraceae bacterium MK1]
MSILVDKSSRVVVQGVTGKEGSFHTRSMREYGTHVVAGVSPGKGGTSFEGIPVFNSLASAVANTGADTSIIFVPPAFAADSIYEAIEDQLKVTVCVTDGIPIQEMMLIKQKLKESNTVLIGSNCPGLITPGEAKLGIMPSHIFKKGPIGVASRSGSLSYEVVFGLTERGIGQSTVVGVGGDGVKGTNFTDLLPMFEADPETEVIVLIGEIGGADEEQAAQYIKSKITKPVVSYIIGASAPSGKKMGHAGTIITHGKGTYQSKIHALQEAGVHLARTPLEVAEIVEEISKGKQLKSQAN